MADRFDLEEEIRLLEVQALNFSTRYIQDAAARQYYIRNIRAFVDETRTQVRAGALTPQQGARAASQMRNEIMEAARVRSSDIGRAGARALKAKGLAFDDLVRRYSQRRFGAAYDDLTSAQQRQVMEEIIESSARANPQVTARVSRYGRIARVVWVMTVAVACYNVFTAENRAHAAGREAANIGGGILGGAAAGAAAGIWFGPLGVAVGAAVGGVVGAVMADEIYMEAAGTGNADVDAILDPYTGILSVDADGIARALVYECGINMDRALAVFGILRRDYSMSSDNVAVRYVERVRSAGGSLLHALRLHGGMREMLTSLLRGGYRSGREADLANWVEAL